MASRPRYEWHPVSRRYFDTQTGRFVPQTTVRNAIDVAIQRAQTSMQTLATQLKKGDVSAAEWTRAMREEIKAAQLAAGAAARGGFDNMTSEDFGRVGGQIANQYKYLNSFAEQINNGLPLDGRFTQRIKLYAQAARGTYEETARDVATEQGVTEEKNILHVADHCIECVALAAMGWVPVGTHSSPGQRECGNNCHCTMSYR